MGKDGTARFAQDARDARVLLLGGEVVLIGTDDQDKQPPLFIVFTGTVQVSIVRGWTKQNSLLSVCYPTKSVVLRL